MLSSENHGDVLDHSPGNTKSLSPGFHPLIQEWFSKSIGKPTSLQAQAWPLIAGGEHVLISAPTGSGKTFAAFLWAINQLVNGAWLPGHTSVVYVSPLKALNNDIQRNLLAPLDELRRIFERRATPFPELRVMTRSGDTPPSLRRAMVRRPPEILITTPESLNLILSSPASRSMLKGVRTVIMDEVHGVVGNKRGVHLITAVERMVPLSGEFQRIALSATVRPLETVAEFIGGYRIENAGCFSARPVKIVRSLEEKAYDIRVQCPVEAPDYKEKDSFWIPYVLELKRIIQSNRSTLIFANSRRLCEKLIHLINLDEERPIAYAHHGSLSREIRTEVEKKLKQGDLRAIVATNSLELGIDIGVLDEVVLVQSPPSLSSAVQRLGRAGHQVGQISRGTIYPTDPQGFGEAAVMAAGVVHHDIESTMPILCPLDVLSQVIVSMAGVETWDLDRLFDQVRTSYPYRFLSREQFDLLIRMLEGRYGNTRIYELKPAVSVDRVDNTVRGKRGALQAVYLSGGTIPDRGYFHLRHLQSNARIGDLDEEFVWEASVGQVFTLGTQNWRIERITHNDVFVLPSSSTATAPPFWKAEENLRDFHFSERIALFMEDLNERLNDPDIEEFLTGHYFMDGPAAARLVSFLKDQSTTTRCPLPHRHHFLVEHVKSGPAGYPGTQVVLHTLWGGRVNRPFAMSLEAAWEAKFGHEIETYVSNDCIMLQLPHEASTEEILSLVTGTNLHDLLKKKLEGSGFFGARFRECAGRALLLPRRKVSERMPLWLSRLRSQRLLGSVMGFEDFPILLETWRTCLKDEFDMESLFLVLTELEQGIIRSGEAHTAYPSPMARILAWGQVNQYMYMDDRMKSGKTSMLRSDLLREVVFTPGLRPSIPRELVERFVLKMKRLAPGYSPETSGELLDWVKERVLVPASEWAQLLSGMRSDHEAEEETFLSPVSEKLVMIHPRNAADSLITALELLPRIMAGVYGGEDLAAESLSTGESAFKGPAPRGLDMEEEEEDLFPSLLSEWLHFSGPVTRSYVRATLGCDPGRLEAALADLLDNGDLISGNLVSHSDEEYVCDSGNFEILLRLNRLESRPPFEALDIRELPLFMAAFQGIAAAGTGPEALEQRMEQLVCYGAPAEMWESDILPGRLKLYEPAWLDTLIQSGELSWLGSEKRQVTFYYKPDLLLLAKENGGASEDFSESEATGIEKLFADPRARYDFSTLFHVSNLTPSQLAERLWKAVWQGRVTNDGFLCLRRGIETGFKLPSSVPETRRMRRRSPVPMPGNWQVLSIPIPDADLVEKEERCKERARLLLDRYGLVFKELLQNESPPFRWSSVFRALRLMELSGEVMTGYFFEGIPGPQFISHEAFRMLGKKLPEDAVYWMSVMDPASFCGSPLEALKGKLPRRVPGTHLVYHGSRLVLVSQRNGSTLTFQVPPDDSHLDEYLAVLHHLLNRKFRPVRRIVIETINEEAASRSPYLEALRRNFDVSAGHRKVTLYRKSSSDSS
jgi:ATP-dependent helicase Lhr and Lhr-like helicase